jgi:hypothetical protein
LALYLSRVRSSEVLDGNRSGDKPECSNSYLLDWYRTSGELVALIEPY